MNNSRSDAFPGGYFLVFCRMIITDEGLTLF